MDTEQISKSLSGLAGDGARAARADAEISKAAHERRAVVESELEKLKPTVLTDREAAEHYEDLISERGHLDLVISRSRRQ